ncbi:MAG: hypothetical protein ACI81T_003333, partial [Bacteroidia bacterium]
MEIVLKRVYFLFLFFVEVCPFFGEATGFAELTIGFVTLAICDFSGDK